MHVPNHHVWLRSQEDCQSTIVHEVAVSASGNDVCVAGSIAVEEFDLSELSLLLCNSNWFACVHKDLKLYASLKKMFWLLLYWLVKL